MDRQRKADMMLVLATGFWGISNCLIAICLRDMQPVTLNAFRFLSAFAVLGAVFHKRVLRASRETWRYSVLVGLSLVAIYLGATYGVLYTSVSNAGFIGAMTVLFTPFFEFVVYRKRPDRKLGFALAVCMAGMALLTLNEALRPAPGDIICLLVLVLFMLPLFIQQNFGIELPSTLEIIILLFIFASEILGELKCYFITYPHWDSMLHTTTGFLCAATGFALIDILNRNSKIKFELSPVYVSLVAFCFSMTIGVLWEFFEFGMDRLFLMDMQKDTIIHSITSVMLDPTNMNIPVTIGDITSVAVNGQELGFGGYLDIGLYDTMEDLFVNFIGALVFSFIGYFYIKRRGEGKIAKAFIPTITEEECAAELPEGTEALPEGTEESE